MTSFIYNDTVPATNDNPSVDQPIMLSNAVSIFNIWNVDHVGFNSTGGITPAPPGSSGGQHLQVTFNGNHAPAAQTDPLSVLYTNVATMGAFNTASAAMISEVFYRNQSATFPVSMIKAFGCFDNNGNSLNAWNLVLASVGGHPSAGVFVLNMPVNCCGSVNYTVLISSTGNAGNTALTNAYLINSATQFTLNFIHVGVAFQDPNQFSVAVLQL